MESEKKSAYKEAGVDIDAQDEALDQVKRLVRSTRTAGVLSELGSFGGLFKPDLSDIAEPVLVASADGVGTKLMVARMAGDFSSIGRDLVNHCVNDILVQGAVPLFFMDYVGAGVLEPGPWCSWSTGWRRPAGRMAVPSWVAKPLKCLVSTKRVTTSWWASWSVLPIAAGSSMDRGSRPAICWSACPRRGCTPMATRWRGVSCSTSWDWRSKIPCRLPPPAEQPPKSC